MALKKRKIVSGKLQYNRRGFGFLIPENGSEDVFIPYHSLGDAVHGDRINVEVSHQRGKVQGRVRDVVSRGIRTVVGKFVSATKKEGVVIPLGRDLPYPVYVPLSSISKILPETVVVVSIDWKKSTSQALRGEIKTTLGLITNPTIDSLIVAHRHELPLQFPIEVTQEAEGISDAIPHEEIKKRKDLRHLEFFTIDGIDARDFDDAIALDADGSVWVAIADVSHYVPPDSKIDQEASSRGNSYYFPDRVIPMIPEKLSNNICSLKPLEDRLVLAVQLWFSEEGDLTDSKLYEGIIRSRARLTYDGVDRSEYPQELSLTFKQLRKLTDTLFNRRMSEGGIDFDLYETKIILRENGEVAEMARRVRTPSQRIVEELMLSANRAVASILTTARYPVIFRVHDRPDPRKLAAFIYLLRSFGHQAKLDPQVGDPVAIDRLLRKMRKDPRGKVFSQIALRSMKQAFYTLQNIGHYGLGFSHYAHFTSPIRRYADLLVHRFARAFLRHQSITNLKLFPQRLGTLEHVCMLISDLERVAQTAEREMGTLKGVRFLQNKRGKIYKGFISGVISQGFFVELVDHAVEGFVPIVKLRGDRYDFLDREMMLKGRRKGKTYRLGDPLSVRVDDPSIEEFRIEFSLAV